MLQNIFKYWHSRKNIVCTRFSAQNYKIIIKFAKNYCMNSIKICLEKTDEDLFMRSKWWGDPDLPVKFDVPDDLTFICQIRCDEIAEFDKENLLPHKGMLYFFAAIDYYFGDFDAYCPDGVYWDKDDIKVIYVEDIDNQEFEQVIFVDEDNMPVALEERKIVFSMAESHCDGNKMLGEPYNREWEDWDEPYNGWIELLQVDSDDYDEVTLNFMDWGMLHIFINPNDLKNKEFSKVTSSICST